MQLFSYVVSVSFTLIQLGQSQWLMFQEWNKYFTWTKEDLVVVVYVYYCIYSLSLRA